MCVNKSVVYTSVRVVVVSINIGARRDCNRSGRHYTDIVPYIAGAVTRIFASPPASLSNILTGHLEAVVPWHKRILLTVPRKASKISRPIVVIIFYYS